MRAGRTRYGFGRAGFAWSSTCLPWPALVRLALGYRPCLAVAAVPFRGRPWGCSTRPIKYGLQAKRGSPYRHSHNHVSTLYCQAFGWLTMFVVKVVLRPKVRGIPTRAGSADGAVCNVLHIENALAASGIQHFRQIRPLRIGRCLWPWRPVNLLSLVPDPWRNAGLGPMKIPRPSAKLGICWRAMRAIAPCEDHPLIHLMMISGALAGD